MKKFKVVFSTDSLSFLNDLEFIDNYEESKSIERNIDEILVPIYTKSKDRICSFCGGTKAKGSKFKEKKHIIPAFFGDPKFYSVEECDACNNIMGKLYESNLADMLTSQLITTNIKGRKNSKTITYKGSKKEVKLEKEGGITFKVEHPPNFDSESGEIEVNIPQNPFVPKYAIKSLLHMIWLFMDKEDRGNFEWLKTQLLNTEEDVLLTFISGYYQRKNNNIRLCIYNKISEDSRLADTYFTLYYGCYFISYCLDEFSFKPFILPDFEVFSNSHNLPHGQIIDLTGYSGTKYYERKVTYNFQEFSSNNNSNKNKIDKTINTFVSIYIDGNEYINKTKLNGFRNGNVEVGGYDLAGNFKFNCLDISEIQFRDKFDGASIISMTNTLNFIKNIKHDSKIVIKDLLEDKDLFIFNASNANIGTSLIKIVDELIYICRTLDIDLKFKQNRSIDEDQNIHNLYSYMTSVLTMNISKIDFQFDNKLNFTNFLEDNNSYPYQNIRMDHPKTLCNFLDVSINLADYYIVIITNIKNIESDKVTNKVTIFAEDIKIERKPLWG